MMSSHDHEDCNCSEEDLLMRETAQKIEQLLIEHHLKDGKIRELFDPADPPLITGVDFVISFDVNVIVHGQVKAINYGLSGNQNETTSLGLVIRAGHFIDEMMEARREELEG